MSPTPKEALAQVYVVIADDDRRIALIVREVLESLGFVHIHMATDGNQAVELIRKEKADLLITDWQMSPMDGISLVKYLRTSNESPNRFLPIIMMTGQVEREHVETARDSGITEFVIKPFSAKTLSNRIVALIENPRGFIISNAFTGPDRRRRNAPPPENLDRRKD
jgi:two-component system chemotaxis response regulator CheY